MLTYLWLLSFSAIVICSVAAAIGESAPIKGLTAEEVQGLLNAHNEKRTKQALGKVPGQPAAADMVRLEWSKSSAAHAQVWAEKCGGPAHGNHKEFGEGQNFAKGSYSADTYAKNRAALLTSGAMKSWFDEEYPGYKYGQEPGNSGHYTQIVTAFSIKMGCGMAQCNKDPRQLHIRLVCNFFVGGNTYGKPPFQKGPACSKCPAGYGFCKDSLCTSPRVCSASDSSCKCTVDQAKCAKNGKFNAATCSCECKVGFQGLNCDESCDDVSNKGCKNRAETKQCQPSPSNKYFVDTYLSCPASCGRCKPACKNEKPDADCAKYKTSGNCENNPDFMQMYCMKECGFCKTENITKEEPKEEDKKEEPKKKTVERSQRKKKRS